MNNTKSNISIKIDANIKEAAKSQLDKMGLTLTTAIELFLKHVIEERSLPFEPEPAAPSLDEQLLEAFQKLDVPVIELEANENGNVIIDDRIKKEHPDIYDWAVNG